LEFGNHQLEVLPTRCCGEYLESLEIKFRWFTQAPRGVPISSNLHYLSNLDMTWGAWSYKSLRPQEDKGVHEWNEGINYCVFLRLDFMTLSFSATLGTSRPWRLSIQVSSSWAVGGDQGQIVVRRDRERSGELTLWFRSRGASDRGGQR